MRTLDCKNFQIDRDSAEPLHLQLKQMLLREMRSFAATRLMLLPSERELAALLSLSRPTVHRAYAELLAEKLVRRRPDKSLEILSDSRCKIVGSYRVVGVLLPMDFPAYMENNHQNALPYLKGLIGRASELNMSCLMLRPPSLSASPADVNAFLDEHLPRLYGLIHLGAIRQTREDDWVLRHIMKRKEIPQVCVSGFANHSHIGAVYVDPVQGMEEACAFLQMRGYKSLGVVSSPSDWPQSPFIYIAQFREKTMIELAQRHGMEICGVVSCEDVAAIRQLLQKAQRPDVLFCQNDWIAGQVMEIVRDLHLRIPEDIGILGYDGRRTDGSLASIRLSAQQVASESIDMIVEHFEQGITDKNRIRKLASAFVLGSSL